MKTIIVIFALFLYSCSTFAPIQSPRIKSRKEIEVNISYEPRRITYTGDLSGTGENGKDLTNIFQASPNACVRAGFLNRIELSGMFVPALLLWSLDLGLKARCFTLPDSCPRFTLAAFGNGHGMINIISAFPKVMRGSGGLIGGLEFGGERDIELVFSPAYTSYLYDFGVFGTKFNKTNYAGFSTEANSIDVSIGAIGKLLESYKIKATFGLQYHYFLDRTSWVANSLDNNLNNDNYLGIYLGVSKAY